MKQLQSLLGPILLVAILAVGWMTRDTWKPWLIPSTDSADAEPKEPPPENPERVKLSEQAQKNLRLIVKEAPPTTYWRKIYLPGTVVDRPGHSDRAVSSPIAGIVTQVSAVPGKTIHVGDELFRIRIASDSFQTSQMELYKSTRELEITQKERKRLESVPQGVIAPAKLLELDYQRDRLKVLIQAHRQDLQTRLLTPEQIANVEKGQFVTEVIIRMPDRSAAHAHPHDPAGSLTAKPIEYEVQELKVNLGDHVQAGQALTYLSDHRYLYIEGRALKQEANLLARAAKEAWPVEAEFSEEDGDAPAERLTGLTIEFLGSTMDASGLTLPVYVPFANPRREYQRQGKTYHTGQYRPGQKVLLKVAVSKMPDVLVLPIAAVAREGPEAYVFKVDGSSFLRKPVHVLVEDTDVVVIENDGTILPHHLIAYNAASALNRVLKASQGEGGGGGHHHHDHAH
jgi:multidrug efflux pump subunit AcrA (membrane-fusion protein)